MKPKATSPKRARWIGAGENLFRHSVSGMFYVRVKRGGRQIWRALGTDKVSVARLRRAAAIAKIGAADADGAGVVDRKNLTLGACAVAYMQGQRDKQLKLLSLEYCARSLTMLRAHCPGFDGRPVEAFTPHECQALVNRLRAKYSARRFNGALWALRGLLEVARKSKVVAENVAAEIPPARIHQAKLELPAEEKIELLMDCLRRGSHLRGGNAKRRPVPTFNAFLFMALMLESAARPGSIRLLRPEHINLQRGTVAWVPFKHSATTDVLPMTRKMKSIFRLLLRRHPGGQAPLLPVALPRKALITVCRAVGIVPALTLHKFRHICSTRMAERNVPYALAAQWRRDTDGGGTFMKVYVHPRNESMRQVVAALERRGADEASAGAAGSSVTAKAAHTRRAR